MTLDRPSFRPFFATWAALLLVALQVPTAVSIDSSSSIVQHAFEIPAAYLSNYTYTLPLPVMQGDLLVVAAAFSSGTAVRISDTLHSNWTRSIACYYQGECFPDLGLGMFYAALNESGDFETIKLNTTHVIIFEAFEISNANLSIQGGGGGWADITDPVKPYQVHMGGGFEGGTPTGEFGFAFGAASGVDEIGSCYADPQQSPGNWTIESYCGKPLSGSRQVFGEYGTTPLSSNVMVFLTANETNESPPVHILTSDFIVDPLPGSVPVRSTPAPLSTRTDLFGPIGFVAIVGTSLVVAAIFMVVSRRRPPTH